VTYGATVVAACGAVKVLRLYLYLNFTNYLDTKSNSNPNMLTLLLNCMQL